MTLIYLNCDLFHDTDRTWNSQHPMVGLVKSKLEMGWKEVAMAEMMSYHDVPKD